MTKSNRDNLIEIINYDDLVKDEIYEIHENACAWRRSLIQEVRLFKFLYTNNGHAYFESLKGKYKESFPPNHDGIQIFKRI